MKYFLFIFGFFSLSLYQAQSSKLTIVSLDSTIFQAAINGKLIGDSSSFEVTDSLILSDISFLVDIIVPSEGDYHISSDIVVQSARHDIYNLQKLGDDFVLILFSSKDWIAPADMSIESNGSLIPPDSLALDSLIQSTYSIPAGCTLQNSTRHENFMNELKAIDFEFQRIDLISELLKSVCILSSQALDIFNTVEYEDKRLDLILNYKDRIVDTKNIGQLQSLFLLKVNREAFLQGID